jgi:chromosome partitioning protein
VLIDTPTHLGLLVACALIAADHVLIPVSAGLMDLEGVADLRATIDVVRRRVNPALELSVVVTRVDERRRLPNVVLSTLQDQFPGRVLGTHIHEAARLAEAYGLHEPITVTEPYTRAADEHRQLAQELLKEIAP